MMRLRRLFLAVLAGGLLFGVLAVPNASAVAVVFDGGRGLGQPA
jgi:hypothetical protein